MAPSARPDDASLTAYRADGGDAAIVFVHGFGSTGRPFGRFPELLADTPALDGWDLYGLGYNTGLMPDLRPGWSEDPPIAMLSGYLRTRVRLEPLEGYGALALVAHSMGGLVVQRALLDDEDLADRVSHVFCFGTPSGGLRTARWGGFLKRQVDDMSEDGKFIVDLRRQWKERFSEDPPFEFWAVAGDSDVFVPPSSSLDPFPDEVRLVVPGDHLELVDLEVPGSMSQQVVVEGLIGSAAPAGPWNAARVAVERGEFDRAIRELLPIAAELDEEHLVDLALALDGAGRRDEAIAVLERHGRMNDWDAKGSLAGRLKRNWQAQGRRSDAESAVRLYAEGLEGAEAAEDRELAYYHAINLAFLELAYRRDRTAAAALARRAVEHAALAPPGYWRSATEGEARLHLAEPEAALESFAEAIALGATPQELESTYVQASAVADELGLTEVREQLDHVFRPRSPEIANRRVAARGRRR